MILDKEKLSAQFGRIETTPVELSPTEQVLIRDIGGKLRAAYNRDWMLSLVKNSGLSLELFRDLAGDEDELQRQILARCDLPDVMQQLEARDQRLLYWSICGEDGKPFFNENDPGDRAIVEAFSDDVRTKILDAAKAFNRLSEVAIENEKKG
jgi:hypothetical protein